MNDMNDLVGTVLSFLVVKIPHNPPRDEDLLQPLTGPVDLRVGEGQHTISLQLQFDYTKILWRAAEKALKAYGLNLRLDVVVSGPQDGGPFPIKVTMQMDRCNNPSGTTPWGLDTTAEVPFEFHDKAAADLYLSIPSDGNPKQAKLLAAQRKVLAYFFIGFRPNCDREKVTAIPPTKKRTRLAVKAANASYHAFYCMVPSSSGDGLQLATCD